MCRVSNTEGPYCAHSSLVSLVYLVTHLCTMLFLLMTHLNSSQQVIDAAAQAQDHTVPHREKCKCHSKVSLRKEWVQVLLVHYEMTVNQRATHINEVFLSRHTESKAVHWPADDKFATRVLKQVPCISLKSNGSVSARLIQCLWEVYRLEQQWSYIHSARKQNVT